MKSKLSTDELFHFTKFDRLLNIINEGFHPHYNHEYAFLSDSFNRPALIESIPMVCFCDIPLNMVEEHSLKYGKCAIGLDKKWGENYGLSPVIYVHKNSMIGDALAALANGFSKYKSSMISEDSDLSIISMITTIATASNQLKCYIKQYERTEDEQCNINGKLSTFPKGRFYDEREWRFVPPASHDCFWLIDAETLHNKEKLKKAHEKLKKNPLKFEINDIRFIISETGEEKKKLIDAIAGRFAVSIKTAIEKITFMRLDETSTAANKK